jgi:hypothetical protein
MCCLSVGAGREFSIVERRAKSSTEAGSTSGFAPSYRQLSGRKADRRQSLQPADGVFWYPAGRGQDPTDYSLKLAWPTRRIEPHLPTFVLQ